MPWFVSLMDNAAHVRYHLATSSHAHWLPSASMSPCCRCCCRTQPLGVLHDLLTPQPQPWPSQQQQQQQQQHSPLAPAAFVTSAIPWCLTVHFRNQPASLVNSWQNSGTAQDHFLSSLKVGTGQVQHSSCTCTWSVSALLCGVLLGSCCHGLCEPAVGSAAHHWYAKRLSMCR
jgi:hypothetical protein